MSYHLHNQPRLLLLATLSLTALMVWSAPVLAHAPQLNTPVEKLDINHANAEALTTLPGIGKVKAKAIVDYRNTNGRFNSVDELINVRGIGDKTLQKLRPLVMVTPPKKSRSTPKNP